MAAHTSLFFLLPHARMLFLHFFPILMSASSNLGSFLLFLPGIRRRHSGRLKRVSAGRGLAQKPALLCTAGTREEHNRQSGLAGIRDDAGTDKSRTSGAFMPARTGRRDAGPGEADGAARSKRRPGAAMTARARPGHHGAAGTAWRGRDTAWPRQHGAAGTRRRSRHIAGGRRPGDHDVTGISRSPAWNRREKMHIPAEH
jgi:hypothetical protein